MMSFTAAAGVIDFLGVAAFAISGAVLAGQRGMDIVGFVVLSAAAGVGGGTLRDLLLGLAPVFWVREPIYLGICIAVAAVVFLLPRVRASGWRVILCLDAAGLAFFAVGGAETALHAGANGFIALVMGVVTASFGGVFRDILGSTPPTVFTAEVYAVAAALGAGLFVALTLWGAPRELALGVSLPAAFACRMLAMSKGWTLPRARQS